MNQELLELENERLKRVIKIEQISLRDYEKKNIAHVWHAYCKRYLSILGSIMRGIGWFISDVKFKYIYATQKNEQCSKCFGRLTTKKPYGGFDYRGKTFYVCKDCYDNLHNKK